MKNTIAYLNGEFIPLEDARISPMDRGFLFADGVYEVIPVYNNHVFRVDEHLKRLQHSLDALYLSVSLSSADWKSIFATLIERNGGGDQSIYLQCTRGVLPTRDHVFPPEVHPTLFAYSVPLVNRTISALRDGIAVITAEDIRWSRCDIKSTALLGNVLLKQKAIVAGAQEAILLRDGFAMEGCASNLFVVKHETIFTPPLSHYILGGITRDVILELARQHQIPCEELMIGEDVLLQADEIWLTSSTREIMPVTQLNGQPIKDGKPGPLWHRMMKLYQTFKTSLSR